MAQTVPGGAYQSLDGSWHDANGKPVSGRAVEELKKLQADKAQQLAAEQAEAQRQAMQAAGVQPFIPVPAPMPRPVVSTETAADVPPGEGEEDDVTPAKPRRPRKS